MKLNCTFEEFTFNTGEKFYQCIFYNQEIPQNENFEFSGQHLYRKYDTDVTFVEFRDCNCLKVPQGLTKTFPNLQVLGISNSKLKEINKDDLAEYKNLQKFICDRNDVDFLPGDLFEGFENLFYLKFTGNQNLEIIEPNLLDELYNLDYVNFSQNINISKFYASDLVYNPNALLGEIQRELIENFMLLKPEKIRAYIDKSKDPKKTLPTFRKYSNDSCSIYDANKINILEISSNIHEAERAEKFELLRRNKGILTTKMQELEESNAKMSEKVKHLDELELKISQQVEGLRKELEDKKKEKEKLQKNLQKQIDNLAYQIQSVMSKME